jgi:hypothetical protein
MCMCVCVCVCMFVCICFSPILYMQFNVFDYLCLYVCITDFRLHVYENELKSVKNKCNTGMWDYRWGDQQWWRHKYIYIYIYILIYIYIYICI